MPSLRCCKWTSSWTGHYCLVAVWELLIAVTSLVEPRFWGAWASVVATRGLDSCSPGALEQRLNSCGALASLLCVVCGIFLDQGSNPCLLHWQADSLPLSHQGSPPNLFLKTKVGKCIKIHSLLLKVEDHSCKLVCLVLQ